MLSRRVRAESQAKADAFAVDWNRGLALEDLTVRHHVRSPMRYAYKLRERGYPLVSRVRRERYVAPEPGVPFGPMTLLRPVGIREDVHARFQRVYDRSLEREDLVGYTGLAIAEEWEEARHE